jgi:hypothetical protein
MPISNEQKNIKITEEFPEFLGTLSFDEMGMLHIIFTGQSYLLFQGLFLKTVTWQS